MFPGPLKAQWSNKFFPHCNKIQINKKYIVLQYLKCISTSNVSQSFFFTFSSKNFYHYYFVPLLILMAREHFIYWSVLFWFQRFENCSQGGNGWNEVSINRKNLSTFIVWKCYTMNFFTIIKFSVNTAILLYFYKM